MLRRWGLSILEDFDWCIIAKALTKADYSSKVGQRLQIQFTWT
jgi:hypothetical protein